LNTGERVWFAGHIISVESRIGACGGVPIPRPARERTPACALIISDSRLVLQEREIAE
jgi:hypothetical protein